MTEDISLPFSFPAVGRKKITAAFDGGRITSDAGVMLLGQAERRLGRADKLAAVIADPRNPLLITHSLDSIFRARILAIASRAGHCAAFQSAGRVRRDAVTK
jgi:hypothetical protein